MKTWKTSVDGFNLHNKCRDLMVVRKQSSFVDQEEITHNNSSIFVSSNFVRGVEVLLLIAQVRVY